MTTPVGIEARTLGRSEVTAPRIALGCGNFGGIGSAPEFFGQGLDEAQAFAVMDAAWDLGINHFDTADAYGGGRSETTIGNWMPRARAQPAADDQDLQPDGIRRRPRRSRPSGWSASCTRASNASASSRSTST